MPDTGDNGHIDSNAYSHQKIFDSVGVNHGPDQHMGPKVHNSPPQSIPPPLLNLCPAWLREGNVWANKFCSSPLPKGNHMDTASVLPSDKHCINVFTHVAPDVVNGREVECTSIAEVKNPA